MDRPVQMASSLIEEFANKISPLDAGKWSKYFMRERITIEQLRRWTNDEKVFHIELRTLIPKFGHRILLLWRLWPELVHRSVEGSTPTPNPDTNNLNASKTGEIKKSSIVSKDKTKRPTLENIWGCNRVSFQMPARIYIDENKQPYSTGSLQISTQETITWSEYLSREVLENAELTAEVQGTGRHAIAGSVETRANNAMLNKMTTSGDVTSMPNFSGCKYDAPKCKCNISASGIVSRCPIPNATESRTAHVDDITELPLRRGVAEYSNLADTIQDNVVTERLLKDE